VILPGVVVSPFRSVPGACSGEVLQGDRAWCLGGAGAKVARPLFPGHSFNAYPRTASGARAGSGPVPGERIPDLCSFSTTLAILLRYSPLPFRESVRLEIVPLWPSVWLPRAVLPGPATL